MPNREHRIDEKKHHPVVIEGRAVDVVAEAALAAQAEARKVTSGAQKLVREHPLASVGVSLATGVLVGAVAHRLLEHKPTFGEALAERLGVNRARDRLRSWI